MAQVPRPTTSTGDLSAQDEERLHGRLLAGDRTASADLAVAYYETLVSSLSEMFPAVDPSLCLTAAANVILELAEHPQRYEPRRRRLAPWLLMKARDDVKNLRRSERRRQSVGPRKQFKVVEFSALAGEDRWHGGSQYLDPVDDPPDTNPLIGLPDDSGSPESAFDPLAERRARQEAILDRAKQEVSGQLDPLDHQVYEMMFDPSGASVEQIAIAIAIGAGHLSLEERRRAAKQVTERISKRIRRAAARIEREVS